MKKSLLCTALIISLMVVFACQSQPQSQTQAQPAAEPDSATGAALQAVYDRHQGSLVLDGAETYTVVHGDTLNGLARVKYDGDGFDYPLILLASSNVVVDEDKLVPGMQLIIPNLQANLADPTARAAFKAVLQEVAVIEDNRNRHATAEGLRNKAATL